MTNDEVIAILQSMIPAPCRADGKSTTHTLETIALDTAIKALEKQKAISELQPPTDNWGTYADRLYDLAYLSGYNDGLIAKGNQDNNV